MIGCARLDPAVEERVLGVFRRLAEAEARVHGSGVDEVTFHEVGAFDSIADIVCACEGIHRLGIERVEISPLFEGRGWVECAHGRLPIPAPATLEILRGVELAGVEVPHEFVTPTGAALACEFAHGFGARPALRIDRIGYGVATRCLPEYPGLLRAIVGEADPALGDGFGRDRVAVIETNLDDLTPELAGALVNRVLDAGALDATLVPVQMKKGRPGFRLEVLVAPERAGAVADVVFVESTAFGLRLGEVSRLVLRREWRDVETAHGVVRVKLGWKGARLLQASPEYESCEAVARAAGVPLRAVYEAATRALGDAAGGAGQEVA